MVPNVPKGNAFVKFPFLENTSLQIWKKLQKLFRDKLRLVIWKSFLRHPLESKAFSPSRISYLRCYFQDLFTSISAVTAMLPIIERPNAILKSEFMNIYAFHISLEKRQRLATIANSDPRTPLMLQLLSILWRLFHFDQGK